MKHQLSELPYAMDALEPHISRETLEYHYGKHHQGYVNKLNKAIEGTEFEDMSLEEVIVNAEGELFNNAAQTWNHSFYWNCMSPEGGGQPEGKIATAIDDTFNSFKEFKNQFTDAAKGNFGSGWTWLVKDSQGNILIENTDDAGNPITRDKLPLLTIDVWEHAYYIDYRNARGDYLDAFWNLVNWDFVDSCYELNGLRKVA